MKPISETHPSLWDTSLGLPCNGLVYAKRITELVRKHTIDKAVLKEILERKRETPFNGTEASVDLYGQVIEELWELVE